MHGRENGFCDLFIITCTEEYLILVPTIRIIYERDKIKCDWIDTYVQQVLRRLTEYRRGLVCDVYTTLGFALPDLMHRPKRNRSSYIIFCNERRANLKEAEPGVTTMVKAL